jgi:hypothetical protein
VIERHGASAVHVQTVNSQGLVTWLRLDNGQLVVTGWTGLSGRIHNHVMRVDDDGMWFGEWDMPRTFEIDSAGEAVVYDNYFSVPRFNKEQTTCA